MGYHIQGVEVDQALTSAQLTEKGFKVGDMYTDNSGNTYRLHLFNNGAGNVAAVVGYFAYVYAVSGTSAGQTLTCTMDLTDTAGVGAGVFMSVPADGEYCWLQVGGIATLAIALEAGSDGNALTPVGADTDGELDVVAAATSHVCAIAIDASVPIVRLCGMM